MNIISTYREVGTYRAAAELCGTTHKTVKRAVERAEAGGPPAREPRPRNFDAVRDLVAERVGKSRGRISAKRLLPIAKAAGYDGSARNFRRLVAEQKAWWRKDNHRGRRPAVWSPGEYLVIDWAEAAPGLFVFCAVLAFSRWRFVRFATDQKASTTLAMIAEALAVIGGVPAKVLADRMGCLKGGVVANVVVPTADYVRFATHYGFRPDWCEAADPASKGIVEHLCGYAQLSHPNPDAVLAPLFAGGSGFFLASDKVQVKYEMLRARLVEGVPVAEAAAAHGYSRAAFYLVAAAFDQSGMAGLIDERRGRRGPVKLRPEIVEFIRADTGSGAQIAEQVAERFGVLLHRRTVERVRGR